MFSYIKTKDAITLTTSEGDLITVSKEHKYYNKISELLSKLPDNLEEKIKEVLLTTDKVNKKLKKYKIQVVNNVVYYKGYPCAKNNILINKIIAMVLDGDNISHLVKFLENLERNPAKHAVDELYGFLEKNSFTLTPQGTFLAYKKVRHDYKDIYSNTFDNSVGCTVQMGRNLVDDNRNHTCSQGLHVCAFEYLKHFSYDTDDRVVLVEVNPADVVSVPVDYGNAKMRVSMYTVVDDVTELAKDASIFDVDGCLYIHDDDYDE